MCTCCSNLVNMFGLDDHLQIRHLVLLVVIGIRAINSGSILKVPEIIVSPVVNTLEGKRHINGMLNEGLNSGRIHEETISIKKCKIQMRFLKPQLIKTQKPVTLLRTAKQKKQAYYSVSEDSVNEL